MLDNKPSSAKETKKILVIAESDYNGCSGVQGATKTALALGCYASTAITSLISKNENYALSVTEITPEAVEEQILSALHDIGADGIYIGFLRNEKIINKVADILDDIQKEKKRPIVIDPSIVTRCDKILMDDESIATLKRRLYIHATIMTPNLKEAEILGAMPVEDIDDMRKTAEMIRTLGVENILLKGAQVSDDKELYLLSTADDDRIYERPTLNTPHTLGAGCALSTALAVKLAKNKDIFTAVENALDFLNQSIKNSDGLNQEMGPINHAFDIQRHPSIFAPKEIKIYKDSQIA